MNYYCEQGFVPVSVPAPKYPKNRVGTGCGYTQWVPTCLFCRVGIYPYPPTRLVYLYSGFGYIEKSGVKRGDRWRERACTKSILSSIHYINSVVCIASECYVVLLKMKTKYMHTYYFTSFLKSLFTAKRIDFSKRWSPNDCRRGSSNHVHALKIRSMKA